jgi:hypothetical protein
MRVQSPTPIPVLSVVLSSQYADGTQQKINATVTLSQWTGQAQTQAVNLSYNDSSLLSSPPSSCTVAQSSNSCTVALTIAATGSLSATAQSQNTATGVTSDAVNVLQGSND